MCSFFYSFSSFFELNYFKKLPLLNKILHKICFEVFFLVCFAETVLTLVWKLHASSQMSAERD